MVLLWKINRHDNPGIVITEENANNHLHAEAYFGKFELTITCGRLTRKLRDSTSS